ncbi:MAG: hypothetical protein QW272_05845 [Candidatus Methanomethylicaceae archaeon]
MVKGFLTKDFEIINSYYRFIKKYLLELVSKPSPSIYKSEDSNESIYEEVIKALESEINELYKDDEIAEHIINGKIYCSICDTLKSCWDLFKELLEEMDYRVFYSVSSKYKEEFRSFIENDFESLEEIEKKVRKRLEDSNRNFLSVLNEIFKCTIEGIKKFLEKIHENISELYYYVIIFLFMKMVRHLIVDDKGKRNIVFEKVWIKDDEYSIQEYFCDISKQLDDINLEEVNYPILLKILEVDFQEFTKDNSKKFIKFLDYIRSENIKEAKKILVGYICEKLKCENAEQIERVIEPYIRVMYNIKKIKLDTVIAKKIFELLFTQNQILELEVFRYISKLGYPCMPKVKIKINDEGSFECDILTLAEHGIDLIEVTARENLNEKVKDRKERREKIVIGQRLPIIFICKREKIEKVKEEPEEDLYFIPFEELNRIKDYLGKKQDY